MLDGHANETSGGKRQYLRISISGIILKYADGHTFFLTRFWNELRDGRRQSSSVLVDRWR